VDLTDTGGMMYEPTEREISIEICKTLNKIEEKMNWILGIGIGILIATFFRG
jgi:hypothetical protein